MPGVPPLPLLPPARPMHDASMGQAMQLQAWRVLAIQHPCDAANHRCADKACLPQLCHAALCCICWNCRKQAARCSRRSSDGRKRTQSSKDDTDGLPKGDRGQRGSTDHAGHAWSKQRADSTQTTAHPDRCLAASHMSGGRPAAQRLQPRRCPPAAPRPAPPPPHARSRHAASSGAPQQRTLQPLEARGLRLRLAMPAPAGACEGSFVHGNGQGQLLGNAKLGGLGTLPVQGRCTNNQSVRGLPGAGHTPPLGRF